MAAVVVHLLFSALPGRAEDAVPVIFTGINLTHMVYHPDMGITEKRVRREMGKVIAEHGGVIDFATVQDVASRITSIYRKAGFVFTRAYVPQQRSTNRWVEVRLLEGWLASIDILDNRLYERDILERPFADLKGKVVYSPELEEAMALLNDYPGLNAFGFYSVGEEPGSTRLNVRVQRERDWTGSLHADNFGSELTGEIRLLAEAEKFNPTGRADHLRVSALQTFDPRNATYGQIDYDTPIFDKRSQLGLRVSTDAFSVSRANAANEQIEFSGKAHSARAEFTRRSKRSNADNRSWHVGVARDISTIELEDFDDVNLDQKTREAYLGFAIDRLDRDVRNWYGLGMDLVAGRYDSIDVPGQSSDYRYAHGFAAYTQGIALGGSIHQWKVNLDWQYSEDLLPAISQFVLTGPTRLRGFLPGDFSADSAALGATTWVLPSWTFGKSSVKPGITMSLFAEYGYGVQNFPSAGASDVRGTLADAGAAWLMAWGADVSATVTVATPLASDIDFDERRKNATRVWIELLWRFH